MACIRVTSLRDTDSHSLMETLGFVNVQGVSMHSVWHDPTEIGQDLFLDPGAVLTSARSVVRLAYKIGLKQGHKEEADRITRTINNQIKRFLT